MDIDYRQVLKALEKYVSYADSPFYRIDRLDAMRPVVEGYYLSGNVSEERFLDICDSLDSYLWDDYKDMYEEDSTIWGTPLEHYIYELQRITGKRPLNIRRWIHLKVEAAPQEMLHR